MGSGAEDISVFEIALLLQPEGGFLPKGIRSPLKIDPWMTVPNPPDLSFGYSCHNAFTSYV